MIAIEPLHGVFHRGGREHAAHGASGLGPCDKPGVAQHVEMLHDGGQRHRERLGQFADRQTIVVAQPRQQRPPGGVGKRSKGAIGHRFDRFIDRQHTGCLAGSLILRAMLGDPAIGESFLLFVLRKLLRALL